MNSFSNHTYRLDLQGLRAIAIILVVLAHLNVPYFEGGFIGVDVFFVLSGYLITGLLIKEYSSTNTINFARFYARRLKRLLPSLLFMVGTALLVCSFLLSPYELISKSKSAIFAATWTSNLYFSFSEVGYFSEIELSDIFLHTWSLSVEEQFYLIWPLFLFSILLIFKNNSKNYNIKKILLTFLFSAFAISLTLSLFWSYEKHLWAFYLMPSRIWQFSLGGIVLVLLNYRENLTLEKFPFQVFGLALIIFSGIYFDAYTTYPGLWALIPSMGAAFVLFPNQLTSKFILANPILVWVGDRSYAWYLWHWPVIILGESFGIGTNLNESILLGAISLLIANVSYKIIEVPIWKGPLSKVKTNKSIRISFLAMTLVVAISLKITQRQEQLLMIENSSNNTLVTTTPSIYSLGCDSWYSSPKLEPCVFNDEKFNKTVVLVGDSILAQWFSAFEEIYSGPEWRLIVFTKSACPIVDEDYFYERIGKTYEVCKVWRNNLIAELKILKPEIIILGSSSYYPFTENQWLEGSRRIFSKLTSQTKDILVIPGTPILTYDGPSCLMRNFKNKESSTSPTIEQCPPVKVSQHIKKTTNIIDHASSTYKNIHVLDLNYLVCPNDDCKVATNSGIPVYRDKQHLTDIFVQHLTPDIKNTMNTISTKNFY